MRRRQVLAAAAAGVAGALAGCSDPRASLRMDSADDADVAEQYAERAEYLRDEHRRIVVDAVEDGSVTVEDADPPFELDRPVEYAGGYYDVVHEVVGRRDATRYEVRVDYSPDGDGSVGEVDYADLPAVDRDALDGLVPPDHGPPDSDGPDLGRSVVYDPEEAEQSVLVPEMAYDVVVHDGDRYLLSVDGGQATTLTEYRYTTEQVAADDAEMAAQVRERYLFELAGLSGAQRKIVDAARDGGYHEEEPSGAFRDIVGRFREHEALDAEEYGGTWLVRYEGDDYVVDLETPYDWRNATVARETPTEY